MPITKSSPENPKSEKTPLHRVLLIGCGSIGERHLRCFLQTGRAQVTACDTNQQLGSSVADRHAVEFTTDWLKALTSGDHGTVVICTPAPGHVPIAREALSNNVHALIEKPLSHSLEGVADLLEASQQSSSQVAVAYVMHTNRLLVEVGQFLRDGGIGPIRQVTVTAGQPFHQYRPAYAQSYYRDRSTGGGAIQDALTHAVNWVESIVGPADSVLCDCAHQVLPGVEVEDTVHLNARHADVLSSFSLNQFQSPPENTMQFNSAEGSVKVELHRSRWGTWSVDSSEWEWRALPLATTDDHFTAQAHAFLDQIEGQPSRLCSLAAGAQTLRFNLAALASSESGSRHFCHDL